MIYRRYIKFYFVIRKTLRMKNSLIKDKTYIEKKLVYIKCLIIEYETRPLF